MRLPSVRGVSLASERTSNRRFHVHIKVTQLALALFVLVALMPAAAVAGRSPEPRPIETSEQARRLFDAPGYVRLLRQRQVAVEEVAAVAAETEGLTPPEALARVSGSSQANGERIDLAAAESEASVRCSSVEWENGRGTFPYRRWIVGHTYWCYQYGGDITYRTSNTSARVDGVCSGSNERDWRISGGAGYSWVVVHHEADFSCVTPWWYHLNDSIWMQPAFNSYGSTSMTDSN